MWKLLVVALAFVVVGACIVLFEGIVAGVDNLVRIRTKADIFVVRDLVARTDQADRLLGPDAVWTAHHRGELWRTFIQCRVGKADAEQTYYWEVDREFSPMRNYERMKGVFVTPLTRATAALTPALIPASVCKQLPEGPGTNAAFLYQAAGIAPRLATVPPLVTASPGSRGARPPGP